jgi:hypothetical protein
MRRIDPLAIVAVGKALDQTAAQRFEGKSSPTEKGLGCPLSPETSNPLLICSVCSY